MTGSLSRRGLLAALGAGGSALAGCLSAPGDEGPREGARIDLVNDAETSRAVTLSFLGGEQAGPEPFGGVTVVSADGSETTVDADSLDEISPQALADAVSFVPEAADPVKYYPDIPATGSLEDTLRVPGGTTWAVYVLAAPSADEPLLGYGQVTCAPGRYAGFSAVMDDDTNSVSVSCRDD